MYLRNINLKLRRTSIMRKKIYTHSLYTNDFNMCTVLCLPRLLLLMLTSRTNAACECSYTDCICHSLILSEHHHHHLHRFNVAHRHRIIRLVVLLAYIHEKYFYLNIASNLLLLFFFLIYRVNAKKAFDHLINIMLWGLPTGLSLR